MGDIIQRIKELMKYYELNISETANKIGVSQPNLSAILSGKRPVGINMINKFVISFNINKEWLKKGIGNMYDLEPKKLGVRIFIIRNSRKWTTKETADFLKIPVSEFQDIEKGKLIPNKDIINDFIFISGANPAWVYSGKGEKFQDWYIVDKKNKNSKYIETNKEGILTGEETLYNIDIPLAHEHEKTFDNIETRPRIPLTAAAGSLSEAPNGVTMEDCEQLPVVHQFPSYDFTMLIKGDSMSPKYESGDEVACRKIDQNRYIQWGKVHVLDTTQGIIIKRVYEDGDKIRCVSYNKEYADFSIPKEDIYSMSLVVGVLSITEM